MTLNADLAIPDQTPFAHRFSITSTRDDVANIDRRVHMRGNS